jgi:hypothetical protein
MIIVSPSVAFLWSFGGVAFVESKAGEPIARPGGHTTGAELPRSARELIDASSERI